MKTRVTHQCRKLDPTRLEGTLHISPSWLYPGDIRITVWFENLRGAEDLLGVVSTKLHNQRPVLVSTFLPVQNRETDLSKRLLRCGREHLDVRKMVECLRGERAESVDMADFGVHHGCVCELWRACKEQTN